MCIGELMILTIINKLGIAEGDQEFNNDAILAFKNSSFTDRRFSFYQKGCLARFQWLEFIARLAHKKFIESKTVETFHEALDLLKGSLKSIRTIP